jgi:RNA polymerase sigma-70 factor, ECF subfamily
VTRARTSIGDITSGRPILRDCREIDVVLCHWRGYAAIVGATEGHAAAGEAFRDYRGQVYRFLLRRTGDHHDAEELTQRVFLEATIALQGRAVKPASTLAWLYAIAERRFIDEIRRRTVARRGVRQLSPTDEAPDLAYGREVSRALRDAMTRLPEDQRRVVILKLLHGMRFAEIADELGISEAACKMRLSRAVAQIKQELGEQGLAPDE